jgi:hypothetical protein
MGFELPQEEHEIDGVRFRITKLPFKLARPTLLLLSGRLLPAAKQGAAAIGGEGDAKARAATALLGALGSVFETLTEADLEKLDEAFGSHCEYHAGDDPKTGDELWVRLNAKGREALFGGGKMALYAQWLVLCGRVNFSDFFDVLKGFGTGRAS